MRDIAQPLTRMVIERAGGRCEYCGLSQVGQEVSFHIDHVVPRAAQGPTELENLALACVSCSLRKGARERLTDPDTGQTVPVFHPRTMAWIEHMRWDGVRIVGQTPIGRGLVFALDLNRAAILVIREEEIQRGRLPHVG